MELSEKEAEHLRDVTDEELTEIVSYLKGDLFSECCGLEELRDRAVLKHAMLEKINKLWEGAYTKTTAPQTEEERQRRKSEWVGPTVDEWLEIKYQERFQKNQ